MNKKEPSPNFFRLFTDEKPEAVEPLDTEVTKEDMAEAVTDEYGVKYSKDGRKLLIAAHPLNGTYTIRMGTEVICDFAFFLCLSLTNINIPNSVTTIGNSTFKGCDALTSIEFPNSVTTIGDCAFRSCKALTSINIPDSVTAIGNDAFSCCEALTSINIPDSVTAIGDGAFFWCEALNEDTRKELETRFGSHISGSDDDLPF